MIEDFYQLWVVVVLLLFLSITFVRTNLGTVAYLGVRQTDEVFFICNVYAKSFCFLTRGFRIRAGNEMHCILRNA